MVNFKTKRQVGKKKINLKIHPHCSLLFKKKKKKKHKCCSKHRSCPDSTPRQSNLTPSLLLPYTNTSVVTSTVGSLWLVRITVWTWMQNQLPLLAFFLINADTKLKVFKNSNIRKLNIKIYYNIIMYYNIITRRVVVHLIPGQREKAAITASLSDKYILKWFNRRWIIWTWTTLKVKESQICYIWCGEMTHDCWPQSSVSWDHPGTAHSPWAVPIHTAYFVQSGHTGPGPLTPSALQSEHKEIRTQELNIKPLSTSCC